MLIVSSAWNRSSFCQVARSTRSSASFGSPRCGSASARRLGDLGHRLLHHGVEERLAGGEVDVDRRADDAGAAGDLGHAGVGIARQRLERCGEDRRNAPICIERGAVVDAGCGCRLLRHLSEPASRWG